MYLEEIFIMKATGIVRRIDDLGRIVIPKEIRRTFKIQEGSPLEIFTDNDGNVIFRKYSPIGEMVSLAQMYAQTLYNILGRSCVVCDTDRVIAVSGSAKKELMDRAITDALRKKILDRKTIMENENVPIVKDSEKTADVICTVVSSFDPMGAIMLVGGEKEKGDLKLTSGELARVAAALLGRQTE